MRELDLPVFYLGELPYPEGGEDWHNDSTYVEYCKGSQGFAAGVIITLLVCLILLTFLAMGAW